MRSVSHAQFGAFRFADPEARKLGSSEAWGWDTDHFFEVGQVTNSVKTLVSWHVFESSKKIMGSPITHELLFARDVHTQLRKQKRKHVRVLLDLLAQRRPDSVSGRVARP